MVEAAAPEPDGARMRRALGFGNVGFIAIAMLIALIGGLIGHLSLEALIGFVIYAALSAVVHQLVIGISAIHAEWFSTFAMAEITLVFGILLGFFRSRWDSSPASARQQGRHSRYGHRAGYPFARPPTPFELAGRRQQFCEPRCSPS